MSENSRNQLDAVLKDPVKLAVGAALVTLLGAWLVIYLPYRQQALPTHGSLMHLAPPTNSLALQGQKVYMQEGCQYCHTQALRPFAWEGKRFASAEAYGYYLMPEFMEYYHESPSMRGSRRIGPDLSRMAGKLDEAQLRTLLDNSKGETMRQMFHRYSHLFDEDLTDTNALMLSWKMRMMMQAAVPVSDSYQKSVFAALDGSTRGDALVEYLSTLGKKQADYAGQFYQ